jgi:hypothetical protein
VGEGRGEGRHALQGTLPQLLAILAAGLFLALDPTFLIGFQQTWWPGPAAIAFYGIFFAAGWTQAAPQSPLGISTPRRTEVIEHSHAQTTPAEYRVLSTGYPGPRSQSPFTPTHPRASTLRVLLAALLFPLLLLQLHRHLETPFTGLNLFALAAAYAAVSWLVSTGLVSRARSLKANALPRPVAFTAEASFWMYLVHHPLVGLTQLAMLHSSIPPLAKFALSLSVGIGLSLASYAVLVRGTWVGQLLNGQGLSRRQVQPLPETPAESESRRAA